MCSHFWRIFQKHLQSTQDTLLYSPPFHISCTSSLTHRLHPRLLSLLLFSLPASRSSSKEDYPENDQKMLFSLSSPVELPLYQKVFALKRCKESRGEGTARSAGETVRAASGWGRLSGAARREHRTAGSAPRAAASARPPPPPPLPPLSRRDPGWEEPAGPGRRTVPAFAFAAALAPPWPFPPLRKPGRLGRGRGLAAGAGPGAETGRAVLARGRRRGARAS